MSVKTKDKTNPDASTRSLIPWRKRAEYLPGRTRRQRQAQHREQINALLVVVLIVVVAGGLFTLLNYQNAGSTKAVSCDAYPQYCVPLAGGAGNPNFAALEAADSRELDAEPESAEGVVRGVDPTHNFAMIGDPDAPIHFVTVSDFACSHCQDFHMGDMDRFIDDYVLTGQATVGFVMSTGTGRAYSELASQAALCAGEQGAFWEMSDEFFRQANSRGVGQAFTLGEIEETADQMGLDSETLIDCVASGRYLRALDDFRAFSIDNGVTGTPTVLVRYGDSQSWSKVNRDYGNLKALTEAANQQAQ